MASPYLPTPDPNDPNDPLAHPLPVQPVPPPPGAPTTPTYTNTNEGRAAYLTQFSSKPWYNGPLFDQYLQQHPDWTENIPYWNARLGDAPGTGSNKGNTTSSPTLPYASRSRSTTPMRSSQSYGAPNVPPQSDLMAKIMDELDAQQRGADSPLTRDTHLKMLRGQ